MLRGQRLADLARGVRGAVVGDMDQAVRVRLGEDALHRAAQRCRAVVDGHAHGYLNRQTGLRSSSGSEQFSRFSTRPRGFGSYSVAPTLRTQFAGSGSNTADASKSHTSNSAATPPARLDIAVSTSPLLNGRFYAILILRRSNWLFVGEIAALGEDQI